MLEILEYIIQNNAAVLCRCYGTGGYLDLPERIDGLPIRELADHCFAPEKSIRIPAHLLRRAVCRGGNWTACPDDADGKMPDPAPLCAQELKEITLPSQLVKTGDYAFYGCRNLERLIFPASFRVLSGGAFVACNHIREIVFVQEDPAQTPPAMKDVISEISYEVTVTVKTASGQTLWRTLFPEYYEESTENTPARIIEIKYRGTGYQCRQCFRKGVFDFAAYDALFYLTSVWEFYQSVVRLCLLRLTWPTELSDKARDDYLHFLQEQSEECAKYVLQEEHLSCLQVLMDYDYFTEALLSEFLSLAGARSLTGAVSLLMDYRQKHFSQAKKRSKYEW